MEEDQGRKYFQCWLEFYWRAIHQAREELLCFVIDTAELTERMDIRLIIIMPLILISLTFSPRYFYFNLLSDPVSSVVTC